jgi:DNA-directed RNA polymerase subunit RPC12/RpoP
MVGSKKMATGKIDAVANGESSEFTISWTPSEAVEGSLSLVLRDVEGQKVTSTKTPVKVEKSAETGGIGDIGSSSTMMYVGIAVLIIIILVIAMAMAGKKKPTSPPGGWAATAPPPKQTTMPKARPAAPQVSAAAAPPPPSGEPGKVKIARIKCPKCKEVMDIKSSKRPLEVRCDNCNAKLLLKK